MKRGDRFILTMQAVPKGDDHLGRSAVYRLRLALKRFLRDYGLRCESVREADDDAAPVPSPEAVAKARSAFAAWREATNETE